MAKELKKEAEEMTLDEAKAYRASLYKPAETVLSLEQCKEEFRQFWAREKSKYGRPKDLEEILWLHLKSTNMTLPKKFQDGLDHFGLKKIK